MNIGTTAIVVAASVLASGAPADAAGPRTSVAGPGWWQGEATAGSGGVVVDEFVPGAYLELRNNSDANAEIGGFLLWLCGRHDVVATPRVGLGSVLSPGEFYVVASSSFTGGQVDQTLSGVLPDGGAALLDPDHTWVDGTAVVADSPCGEGPPAPGCPRLATARDAASTDTGNNVADFACRPRSPGECSAPSSQQPNPHPLR